MKRKGIAKQEMVLEHTTSVGRILTAEEKAPLSPAFGENKTNKYMMIVFNTLDEAKERLKKVKDLKTLQEIRFFAYRKDKPGIMKLVDARIKELEKL